MQQKRKRQCSRKVPFPHTAAETHNDMGSAVSSVETYQGKAAGEWCCADTASQVQTQVLELIPTTRKLQVTPDTTQTQRRSIDAA